MQHALMHARGHHLSRNASSSSSRLSTASFVDLLLSLSAPRRNPELNEFSASSSHDVSRWLRHSQRRAPDSTGGLQCRLSCRRASCFARRVSPSPAASGTRPAGPLTRPRLPASSGKNREAHLPSLPNFIQVSQDRRARAPKGWRAVRARDPPHGLRS